LKLAKREKYMVFFMGIAIALFLLLEFLVFPVFDKKERLESGVEARQAAVKEMALMRAQYLSSQKGSQDLGRLISRRKKSFTLFSFLEKEAGKAKVKDNIKYMKPSETQGAGAYKESMVEMKLEAVTLDQLVGYLRRIESREKLILVKRMSLKESKKEGGFLDAIFQVLTIQ